MNVLRTGRGGVYFSNTGAYSDASARLAKTVAGCMPVLALVADEPEAAEQARIDPHVTDQTGCAPSPSAGTVT